MIQFWILFVLLIANHPWPPIVQQLYHRAILIRSLSTVYLQRILLTLYKLPIILRV